MKRKKILLKLFVFFSFFICILFTFIYFYIRLTPKLDLKKTNNIILYDKNNKVFFKGNGSKEWITLNLVDQDLIDATISIEDKRFYSHNGFDYIRIIKSMYNNIVNGNIVEGASTISQQYARNLYLTFERNWSRKIKEAWLALKLEINYSKDEILEGYLNTINYGNGVMGIQNAARYYFNKSAENLSLAESSMLAGIPGSPQEYSPINNEKSAKARQKVILDSMVKNGYITEEESNEAYNTKLTYYGKKDTLNLSTLMYYKDAVLSELENLNVIPSDYLDSNGIKIYTNLDLDAQTSLENAVNSDITNNDEIQVSSVMVENKSGKVIALTGGRNYEKSQYNRVTYSKRQVGSTMKPFLYYAALENGFTASSTFLSEPTTFSLENNQTYSPANFGNIYPNYPIPLILAVAYSDNIYAIKTHLFLGEDAIINVAKKAGINTKLPKNVSLPLGTTELNIMEFTNAYSTIANEGKKNDLYLIRKVEGEDGKVIYKHKDKSKQVLDSNYTFILSSLLNNCYDNTLADYNSPTCLNIKPKLTKTYAIKTGTTDTDSWTVGYNKDYTLSVWVGYDNNKDLVSKDMKYAKNIWADTIETYSRGREDSWYDKPKDVVSVIVNPLTGKLATNSSSKKKLMYYLKGTQPTEFDNNNEDNEKDKNSS
ncbi:MAG: PBP1A family penicillin-binding protein [Bacilli bacterium]|nr:PBP1A family penicillin-binding protein [Bacilli bacterium]